MRISLEEDIDDGLEATSAFELKWLSGSLTHYLNRTFHRRTMTPRISRPPHYASDEHRPNMTTNTVPLTFAHWPHIILVKAAPRKQYMGKLIDERAVD